MNAMEFDWKFFFSALGLAFILEGIPYFLFAEQYPQMYALLFGKPKRLRMLGLVAILSGLLVILLVRDL